MEVKIKNGSGEILTAKLERQKMTDSLAIEAAPFGIFTITGASARSLQSALNILYPEKANGESS